MTSTIVAYLDQDAAFALGLLKEDISVVSSAAGARGVSPLLLQHALRCATKAFFACGEAQNPAWSELVTAVNDVLVYRSQFSDSATDAASRKRLYTFVNDNADALIAEADLIAS